ncbi:hypothetical protein AS850_07755 [Frondihabitans sp. 762G35]|uniref:SRPBCC family protein n=1 Tax=Frondihabitans sp. 762G35 TaxID=1446794 RepID=UPI000D225706|nr:SRPBCC family protein [Frondihabitans sp. 762G35]ARC56972.1 hypothetical protein AS850_07755 [Frondihabitans sp. 762G35]
MTITANAVAEGYVEAPLDTAWAVGTPMTPVGYYPKYGPLPAVVGVRDQTGPWDAVGQTRQLLLSDGSSVIEHLKQIEKHATFVYELTDFTKILGRLVSGGRAVWVYRAEGSGTTIRWSYSFFARPGMGLPTMLIVRLFWAPYMRRVLPGILAEIARRR